MKITVQNPGDVTKCRIKTLTIIVLIFVSCVTTGVTASQGTEEPQRWFPRILQNTDNFLPDFSYAGYHWGEQPLPDMTPTLLVTDFGAIPNDGKDDTKAIQHAIKTAEDYQTPVIIHFPPGKFLITQILYIKRGHLVLQGSGSGKDGSILAVPKPLKEMKLPFGFVTKYYIYYLVTNKWTQGRLFSPFSWCGGVIWVKHPNPKKPKRIGSIIDGKRGDHTFTVPEEGVSIQEGDVLSIRWYNRDGKHGSFLQHIFQTDNIYVGKRLYNTPGKPLISQPVTVTAVHGSRITVKEPLLHDLWLEWTPELTTTSYLEEVGIEHFRFEFPETQYAGHHIEDGYNGIHLNDVNHAWIRDMTFEHADAAILCDHSKNVTMEAITVQGRGGHYSVHVGDAYGVLVKNFQFEAPAIHNPSFNTKARLCVYSHGTVTEPKFDQHCGVNHQNLFDHITGTSKNLNPDIFRHGGSDYWRPTAGAYNTFWNIALNLPRRHANGSATIPPMNNPERYSKHYPNDAPHARIVGLHGNVPLKINYGPDAYIEGLNQSHIAIPSLYQYQLNRRLRMSRFP